MYTFTETLAVMTLHCPACEKGSSLKAKWYGDARYDVLVIPLKPLPPSEAAKIDWEQLWDLPPPPKQLKRAVNLVHYLYFPFRSHTSTAFATNVEEENGKLYFTRNPEARGSHQLYWCEEPYAYAANPRDKEAIAGVGSSAWILASLTPMINLVLQGRHDDSTSDDQLKADRNRYMYFNRGLQHQTISRPPQDHRNRRRSL